MNNMIKTFLQRVIIIDSAKIQVRNYARWTNRKPLRVVPSENQDEFEMKMEEYETPKQDMKMKWKHPKPVEHTLVDMEEVERISKPKKPKYTTKPKPKPQMNQTDMLETVIDKDGNLAYKKMMNKDSRISILLTTMKSKKEQLKKDLILLEGKKLIQEALQCGCKLKYLLFSRKEDVESMKPLLPKIGAQLYKMPYREMQLWSELVTSPGVMGIFRTPEVTNFTTKSTLPITVVCDNVREPGNLGAILRAAAGIGCKKLILTKGCTHLWDVKVTRAAVGSHFRLQIHSNQTLDDIRGQLESDSKVFIADNNVISSSKDTAAIPTLLVSSVPCLPYYSVNVNRTHEIVIVVGGETTGISEDSYRLANEFNGVRLNIPLSNGVESLNTGMALGIIGFEIKRQLSSSKQSTENEKFNERDVSLSLRNL